MSADSSEVHSPFPHHKRILPLLASGKISIASEMFKADISAMNDDVIDSDLIVRVKARLKKLGMSAAGASNAAGLGKDYIANLFKGEKNSFYGDKAAKLAKVLQVPLGFLTDPDWKDGDGDTNYPDFDDSVVVADDMPPVLSIPEYDIKVSAGGGYVIDRERVKDMWPFSRRYIEQELNLTPGSLSIVEVRGDSMEPMLRTGDRVVVDHGDKNPAPGGVFAMWDGSATVVKRIEKIPYSDPPKLVLISENKSHNQYTVDANVVNVIGRVVWVARRM